MPRSVRQERVVLFNPLPMALAHYETECSETLGRLGLRTRSVSPAPATDEKEAAVAVRAVSHLGAVGATRLRSGACLVLWPAFGWLEPVLWSGARSRVRLIIHDPVPVRRQYGQGAALRSLATAALRRHGPELVCHTTDAAVATRDILGLATAPAVMLHPILTSGPPEHAPSEAGTVLVAGQYKPSRDLGLLEKLGPMLRSAGLRPVIRGRGWPPVSGWEVFPTFVSEPDFDDALHAATVVLVPYTRYWQSNVAVRALEWTIPIVGRKTCFLATLLGHDYPAYVDAPGSVDDWYRAVLRAAVQPSPMEGQRLSYQHLVDETWRAALAQ